MEGGASTGGCETRRGEGAPPSAPLTPPGARTFPIAKPDFAAAAARPSRSRRRAALGTHPADIAVQVIPAVRAKPQPPPPPQSLARPLDRDPIPGRDQPRDQAAER